MATPSMSPYSTPSNEVVVTDVRMPFGSMVIFIFKWTLAAIPAMILLALVAAVVAMIFGSVLAGIGLTLGR